MIEDKNMNGPEKCHNCKSNNITGPHGGKFIYFGVFSRVGCVTYVCVNCLHALFFVHSRDREKVLREMQKQLTNYK